MLKKYLILAFLVLLSVSCVDSKQAKPTGPSLGSASIDFIITPQVTVTQEITGYKTIIENRTLLNVTSGKNQIIQSLNTIPEYKITTTTTYPLENIVGLRINQSGFLRNITLNGNYSYGLKGKVLTAKMLSRGGSLKDTDLTSCYHPGVPCKQYDFSDLNNITVVYEYSDADSEVNLI